MIKPTIIILSTVVFAVACEATTPPAERTAALEAADAPRQQADIEPGALAAEIAVVVAQGDITRPTDLDEDGFPADVDRDDENPFVFPGASEVPCDGIDQDGDSVDPCPADVDGDGARADVDCDDLDPLIGPLASEQRCNERDENCDGFDDCDRDGDGMLDRDDLAPDDPTIRAEEQSPEPPPL